MKAIVRKNDEAVSPVIATILMVAITVVLAAVLYVMVSGLISTPQTSQQIGAAVSRSGDGTNWIITFTSVPSGLAQTTTYFSLTTSSGGSTAVTAVPLSSLKTTTNGVTYYNTTATSVGANDRLTVAVATYPSGTGFAITITGSSLATGKLQ